MSSTILDWIRERFDVTDRVNRKRRDTSIDEPVPHIAKKPRISDILNGNAQEEDGNNQAAYTKGHTSRKELNLSRIDTSSAAFGNPAASSTMKKFMPLNASMMTRPSILDMIAPSQPARGTSSLYASALFTQSNAVPLLKQPPQRQQHSFRSGISHRGSEMLEAALESKRADLFRKLVPSVYSKKGRKTSIRRTDAVHLTHDESNSILDLTGDETPTYDGSKTPKEEDDVIVVEPIKTLLERLSCRPQFNKDLVDQVAGQYSTSKESRKVEIRAFNKQLSDSNVLETVMRARVSNET